MVIHQAYYGERAKGHNLICTSFENNEPAKNILLKTDLPPHSTNISWTPFFSGFLEGNYYVFLKTYPDIEAGRGSFVFTHALFIQRKDIEHVNDLHTILHIFPHGITKDQSVSSINIKVSDTSQFMNPIQGGIASLLNEMINENKVIWIGVEGFADVISVLWANMDVDNRLLFSFRVSFNQKDYEKSDLSVAYSPKELADKWSGYTLVNSKSSYEGVNPSIDYLINRDENNSIERLSKKLNVRPKGISDLKTWSWFADIYFSKSRTVEYTASLVREIGKLSPKPDQSSDFKGSLLNDLKNGLKTASSKNILLLRNVKCDPFEKDTFKMREEFDNAIAKSFKLKRKDNELFKVLQSIHKDGVEEWWNKQVVESLSDAFNDLSKDTAIKIWDQANDLPALFDVFEITIPYEGNAENIMVKAIPNNLCSECIEQAVMFAEKRDWDILFGTLLARLYNLKDGLDYLIDRKSELQSDTMIKAFAKASSEKDFIKFSIRASNIDIQNVAIDILVENPTLKSLLDINEKEELHFLERTIEQGIEVFEGFAKSRETRDRLLDCHLDGTVLSDAIWNAIRNPSFADFSKYRRRSELWEKLPLAHRSFFLSETTNGWIHKFLNDNINETELEDSLKKEICIKYNVKDVMKKSGYGLSNILNLAVMLDNSSLYDIKQLMQERVTEFTMQDCQVLAGLINRKRWYELYRYAKNELCDKNSAFDALVDDCSETFVNRESSILDFIFRNKNTYKKKQAISTIYEKNESSRQQLPTVVILTAIKEEYFAVRNHLDETTEFEEDDTEYEGGILFYEEKQIAKVIIRECGAKNTIAAQETERAINAFNPEYLFFVGIAGSRKPNDFGIGDVIFPEKIYSYEGGRAEKNAFKARPDLVSSSFTIYEKAKTERRKPDWKTYIKGEWNIDNVSADVGIIASGEQLIEHYDSEIGEIINNHYNDTSVVEMEGFGFAKAANRQGRKKGHIHIGVIRGISDILERDNDKQEVNKDNRRPEGVKEFASATAAAFTYWLITKLCS